MMRLAAVGAWMTGVSAALFIVVSCSGLPGWVNVLPNVLLLGGIVNLVIAGAFEARRELRYRAERLLERAGGDLWQPFPVGTREGGELAWTGPGPGSCSRAFSDPRWYAGPAMMPEKTLAAGAAEPVLEEIAWRADRSGILRVEEVRVTIDGFPVPLWQELARPGMEEVACAVMHGTRARVLPPEAREVTLALAMLSPMIMTERLLYGVRFSAPGDLIKGLGSLGGAIRASMTRMPHGPECDCSECG